MGAATTAGPRSSWRRTGNELSLRGSRVAHNKWGEGSVHRYEREDKMVVLFDKMGYKTLMAGLVEEHGLLEPAG